MYCMQKSDEIHLLKRVQVFINVILLALLKSNFISSFPDMIIQSGLEKYVLLVLATSVTTLDGSISNGSHHQFLDQDDTPTS